MTRKTVPFHLHILNIPCQRLRVRATLIFRVNRHVTNIGIFSTLANPPRHGPTSSSERRNYGTGHTQFRVLPTSIEIVSASNSIIVRIPAIEFDKPGKPLRSRGLKVLKMNFYILDSKGDAIFHITHRCIVPIKFL